MGDTKEQQYTQRLRQIQMQRWKPFVPNPYRWKLRRLVHGRTLDVGCGIGRGLDYMQGDAIGIDHNPESVAICRARGFTAYLPDEFARSLDGAHGRYDTLLFSHVFEHLTLEDSRKLLESNLCYLAPLGRVVSLTPQERGYASDDTHVTFMGTPEVARLMSAAGLEIVSVESFPLPRTFGPRWIYNETIVVGRRPAG